jgi:hypothetical protein
MIPTLSHQPAGGKYCASRWLGDRSYRQSCSLLLQLAEYWYALSGRVRSESIRLANDLHVLTPQPGLVLAIIKLLRRIATTAMTSYEYGMPLLIVISLLWQPYLEIDVSLMTLSNNHILQLQLCHIKCLHDSRMHIIARYSS